MVNLNNGARLETYLIEGKKPRLYALNGGAARLAHPGDRLLIMSYGFMDEAEARRFRPTVLVLDEKNRVRRRTGPRKR